MSSSRQTSSSQETPWEVIEEPDLEKEHAIEMRYRRRAARNIAAEQERQPDPAIAFSWRRVYLKLEKRSQCLTWQEAFKVIMDKSLLADLCTHSDLTALSYPANKYAKQIFCHQCKKIVIYNHTKEGVISWMQCFSRHVAAKQIRPNLRVTHPDDPDASQFCKRCVSPMIHFGRMEVCSRHQDVKKPCRYARNGHLPPGDDRERVQQEKLREKKKRLWLDKNTVITPDGTLISGATINRIGSKVNGKKYREILEQFPQYCDWCIGTSCQESSIELKHMAAFLQEARKCMEEFAVPSGSPPCSFTEQPRGKGSFRNQPRPPRVSPHDGAPQTEPTPQEFRTRSGTAHQAYNMAVDSDEEEDWFR